MTEKIELKLCSKLDYEAFIEDHSLDTFLEPEEDFIPSALEFIKDIPSILIEKDQTIVEVAKLVWNEEELIDQSSSELFFKEADDLKVVRRFYCPQLNNWAIPVATAMDELHYKDKLVIYYMQEPYQEPSRASRWRIQLARTNSWVRTYTYCVDSELPDPILGNTLRGVVLSTSDVPNSINKELRKDFGLLMRVSARRMKLTFLEKENDNYDKSFLEYWESKYQVPGQFEAESLVGHTNSMPFSKQELLRLLPGIEGVTGSAQLLLYRDLSDGHILLDIDSDLNLFFDNLNRAIVYTGQRIREEISELKAEIESRLELVELPPYQSEPGSQARMQETFAHVKEKKAQELQGKIAPEKVYETVNEIFKMEGKSLESFDHFKKQFLTYYPDFQKGTDHLLPGDNSYYTELRGAAVGKNIENEAYRSALWEHLTRRDIEVLKLLAKGKTIQEIADALMLVRFSVDTLRKNLLGKLHLEHTKDLIHFAKLAGLDD
ncbi:response regulator transcription factor [Roseivirga misakiensis]|uniref:HTH luxR-type domain-containing protein n=1 Tax=Roseivirga misakiensis TaxID=1563681 RepID=A0A1E5T5A7_9BACT|nr:helix-turn-helix transcriptional regulator [Roseivirga misakiensis]OEK06507.1 hypothetical protein BFP71_02195 [Roseivirga misakiensis]